MFRLIAGPCSIESEEMAFEIAEKMKEITMRLGIDYTFKGSFDKANRTSIYSKRGLGIEEGLRILGKIKSELGLKVCTDIHEANQAETVGRIVDIVQIPAFLCRQTDLLVAAAKTGKQINVKKAQFLSPLDMKNVLVKLKESGNEDVLLCERGTAFGYNNLIVDMTSIIEMKKLGKPVIFDATHSVQKPGGNGETTGGNREYVEYLAKAALAVGADGIFIETHMNPEEAWSDGPNMVYLEDMETLLKKLVRLYEAL